MTKLSYRNYKIIPILLFFIAFSIRIIYLLEFHLSNPFFDIIPPSVDHFNFDQAAINFSEGDLLARSPNNSFAPLYKYFLGFIYLLFGRNFYIIYIIQFTLGSLTALLIFLITKDLFGLRSGIIAFLCFAFYSPQIIYEGIILRAAFISFLGIVSFFLLLRIKDSLTLNRIIIAVLALSLFIQSRPNVLLCLPLVCIYLFKVISPLEPARRTRYWLIITSAFLVSFIPLLIQSYIVHNRFVFFDSSGPTAFISGNYITYSGFGFDATALEDFRNKNILNYLNSIKFVFHLIIDDFTGFIKLYLRKIYFFLNDFEAPSNVSIYLYREFSNTLNVLPGHFSFFSSLGIIGMVLTTKALRNKNRLKIFLLYSFFFSLFLSVILFYNVARFRLPVVPYLIIFSSYTINMIVTWISKMQYKKAFVSILASIMLFITFHEPERVYRIRADDYNNMALAWNEKGNPEKAINFVDLALAVDPLNFHSHFNKGQYYSQKQDWVNAIFYFEKALSLNSKYREVKIKLIRALFNLGNQHFEKQEFNNAVDIYSKIIKLEPHDIDTLLNMGVCNVNLGKNNNAKRLFESILKINPNHSGAKTNLGLLSESSRASGQGILTSGK